MMFLVWRCLFVESTSIDELYVCVEFIHYFEALKHVRNRQSSLLEGLVDRSIYVLFCFLLQ